MGAQLAHFAMNVLDLDEARRFYQSMFGWAFRACGLPGFFHIEADGGQEIVATGVGHLVWFADPADNVEGDAVRLDSGVSWR